MCTSAQADGPSDGGAVGLPATCVTMKVYSTNLLSLSCAQVLKLTIPVTAVGLVCQPPV
jgi:hypothetical protein